MGTKTLITTILETILLASLVLAVTITGQASSYTFTLENCSYTTAYEPLNCSASTIRYECDINPANFVDSIDYRINGVDYTATQNSTKPSQFYYTYTKPNEFTSNNTPITFDRQRITDVDNKKVNAYIVLTTNHTCLTCDANFIPSQAQACNITNEKITQYTSSNLSCQPSYNQTETCDYCQPNLISNTTSCLINNTQITQYHDLAYTSCCQATNLTSDCPTLLPPYNQPISQNCQYYQNDMPCQIDETPVIADKINLNCELPNLDNGEACCVINTYQNQNTARILLATSPEYQDKTTAFSLFGSESETRNCFPTQNRLLNAYYTNKELRPNMTYEIEVTCSTNTSTYKTLQTITPQYHTPDEVLYRIQWVGNNPVTIIVTILVIIAGIALAIYVIHKIRRR